MDTAGRKGLPDDAILQASKDACTDRGGAGHDVHAALGEGLALTQHHHLPGGPLRFSARSLCNLIGLSQSTGVLDRCCVPSKELLLRLHSSVGGLRLVHLVL